ncbi:MAG: hypothetical protein IPJ19_03485 [Planctomycetes bacterium]|nr:hypothetical protein [Planctomycetota bacterium]
MKLPCLLLLASLCAACVPLYGRETKFDFHGEAPLAALSGEWNVVEVADAPSPPRAWMQQAASPENTSNLALCDSLAPRDADLRVMLRPVEGALERGGGLVWRARDERNYYLACWNPLEKSVRAYKVVDGVHTQIASCELGAAPGWHRLRVWYLRDKIEVWLDQHSLGEFSDATFAAPGRIGLWTGADARTQFDNLEIQEL